MEKEKIIQFITKRRKELGYSQNYVASELGISDQAVSNWERGISFPDITYFDDIAKILDTNVKSLVNGNHEDIKLKENVSFDIERFRTNLISLRKANKLTQNQLGSTLEISGQNVSKYENGAFLPSIEIIEKYAKCFNLSILNVYYGLDDEDLYIKEDKKIRTINKKKIAIFSSLFVSIIIGVLMCVLFFGGFFKETHIVTVVIGDEIKTYEVRDKEEFALPSLPTKKGYDVLWDDTNNLITDDKTFTVVYTPKVYKITYDFLDEDIEEYVQEVKYGEEFELYIPDYEYFVSYSYQDKVFEGGVYDYDYDIVIKANYNNYRTVTIIIDKDNIISYTVKIDTNITLPEIPNKIGYNAKWNDTDTLISENKTYYVIYTAKQYKITYVYENDILESFDDVVTYGEYYNLYIPSLDNYSFLGYIYNGNNIENEIYLFDHDITICGIFSNEVYTVFYEFTNHRYHDTAGYGCLYAVEDLELTEFIGECYFNPNEYSNYKIIAWKDKEGNIYDVGELYLYDIKSDLYLWPIFEYSGTALEVSIENDEAKIIKYNISKISNLIIPDYIVLNNRKYKVTEISPNTFQDTYFMDITLSSNITRISKNTFKKDILDTYYASPGFIYYGGTLEDWFRIDFEEYIVSNGKESHMRLFISSFLVGEVGQNNSIIEIPESIEVIKSYSCAYLSVRVLIINDNVHTIEENAFIFSVIDLINDLNNVENVHENAFN